LEDKGLNPERPHIKSILNKMAKNGGKIEILEFTQVMTSHNHNNIIRKALRDELASTYYMLFFTTQFFQLELCVFYANLLN